MKVSVIGAAGSVGAPAAFYLAASGLVEEMVLIDMRPNVVEQHAMDMNTAVSALDATVKAGDFADMAGSDLVINAAGVPQGVIKDRMEMLPANIPLVRDTALKIKQYCPEAIILTATNPVDPLNYATFLASGFDRGKVLGYSINDSFRFRELVAQAKGVKVSQVQATVVGEHGSTQVPLFSSVTIDGRPVSFTEVEKWAVLDEIPQILRRYEELKSGRTAGWTCAVGMAKLVRAIRDDSGKVLPCSVVLQGEYGRTDVSMSVPVSLGREGAREVQEWTLAPDEEEKFEKSAAAMAAAARIVDETLQQDAGR